MTDDIVDWLREYGERNAQYQCCDAADEIEQLRAALREIEAMKWFARPSEIAHAAFAKGER